MSATDDIRLTFELSFDLFRRGPDAIIVVDTPDAVIRMVNEQALLLTGWAESDLLHQPIEVLVPEDRRVAHQAHRFGYIQQPYTRPMGAGLDLDLRRVDGQLVPVEINLALIPTQRGNFVITTLRRRRLT